MRIISIRFIVIIFVILFSLANNEYFITVEKKITKIATISFTEIILIIDQFFAQNLSKELKLY